VVLYAVASPPLNLGLLVFLALAPWFVYLARSTAKGSFWTGALFGFVFWLHQMVWLLPFVGRWTGSFALAAVPWVLASAVGCWYFAVAGWLVNRCFTNRLVWFIPLVWAGMEVVRSFFPMLAFPWGLLASPLWFMPQLIQGAALGTVFMVSAWVALVNLLVVMVARPQGDDARRGHMVFRMAIVASAFGLLSFGRYVQAPAGKTTVFSIGQPGVDVSRPGGQEAVGLAAAQCMALATVQGSKALVMPEGLVRVTEWPPKQTPFGPRPPIHVLFGGSRSAEYVYQSAFAWDGEWSYVDKTRLVIFGEYVPFRGMPGLSAFNLAGGDMAPGEKAGVLELGGITVAPMLCFEALFPDVCAAQSRLGSQLVAVMSVDDWYRGTPAMEQLLSGSVFRAVEAGVPLLRSATTGITAAVDARGNLLGRAAEGPLVTMRVEAVVPERSDSFEYRMFFPWVSVAAMALAAVWPMVRRRS
jgi:apolipoprotein N-acyltransferase